MASARLLRLPLLAPALLLLACSGGEAAEAPQQAVRDPGAGPCAGAERQREIDASRSPERAALVRRIAGVPAPEAATPTGPLSPRVLDRAELLSVGQEQSLAEASAALEGATTDQLAVVTIRELGGLTIEQFGLSLGNAWGVGRRDRDNGVVLLVAPTQRKVRIEVGCGLESTLTDARAAEIVDRMLPHFSEGNHARAIALGVSEIDGVLRARPERPNAG
ncbi:MAG TPA: TPM domain-containing protein [Allosphingosinicella sp.]